MASELQRSREPFFKEKREFPKRFGNGFPVGARTERRAKENAKLRKLDIKHCEIRISPNCARNRMLTWAHSQKSRFLVTGADWQEAARCCLPCHDVIEALPHSEMKKCVCDAIRRRNQISTKQDRTP
jgi:hypothetical protein